MFLRNATFFHHFTSSFLQEVGTLSLWLFVSHFHILSALNGRGMLALFPGNYFLNTVGVVTVYVYVAMVIRLSIRTLSDWSIVKEPTENIEEDTDTNV